MAQAISTPLLHNLLVLRHHNWKAILKKITRKMTPMRTIHSRIGTWSIRLQWSKVSRDGSLLRVLRPRGQVETAIPKYPNFMLALQYSARQILTPLPPKKKARTSVTDQSHHVCSTYSAVNSHRSSELNSGPLDEPCCESLASSSDNQSPKQNLLALGRQLGQQANQCFEMCLDQSRWAI